MKSNKHSNQYKLEAINDYKAVGNKLQTAKKFKIDRKTLTEWLAAEEAIRGADPDRYRLDGAGRKMVCVELDGLLVEKIQDERLQKKSVSRKMIVQWAKEIALELDHSTFEASTGWLDKFLRRNQLTIRKANRICSLDDDEVIKRGLSFIIHLKRLINEYKILPKNIYNFDETAIFIEDDHFKTIEQIGAKKVPVVAAGMSRLRITSICAASAAGTKLPPTVIFKGKNESISTKNGVVQITAPKSWVNTKLFKMWIDYMFPMVTVRPNELLLIFDSARCHISKEAKEHLQKRKILFCIIPGGLTSLLQPADAFWFKSLKDCLRGQTAQWFQSDACERTKSGRIKPPPCELISKWVNIAWDTLSKELIIKSFYSCFLDEGMSLLIAKDAQFGIKFRTKYCASINHQVLDGEDYSESSYSEIDE